MAVRALIIAIEEISKYSNAAALMLRDAGAAEVLLEIGLLGHEDLLVLLGQAVDELRGVDAPEELLVEVPGIAQQEVVARTVARCREPLELALQDAQGLLRPLRPRGPPSAR